MPEYYNILGLRYKKDKEDGSRQIGIYYAGKKKHTVYIPLSENDIKNLTNFSRKIETLLKDEPIKEKRKKKIMNNLEAILKKIHEIEKNN